MRTAIAAAVLAISMPALAAEQTAALNVTVTVTEPPIWIEASDDTAEVTITAERAMAYCDSHGLGMHECRVVPAELAEWEKGR